MDERIKEVQAEAALNAEHFFSCFLSHRYGENYDPLTHWRSSLRKKVYHDSSMNHTIDDRYIFIIIFRFIVYSWYCSCGYDFEIRDSKHLFDSQSDKKVQTSKRMCFFEVKGCAGPWRGEFHISENEIQHKERAEGSNGTEV